MSCARLPKSPLALDERAEDMYQKYEAIVSLLQSSGVQYTIHEHAPSFSVADARERLPFPVERLLKTIAFRIKAHDFILAGVRGPDRIDYRKLAGASGTKRADIVQLTPEEVAAAFGMEVGSVSPISLQEGVVVFFDTQVSTQDTVFCGIGRADRTLEIHLMDLVQITRGQVLPLIKD
jgi:Cys-tRNA(Pro)/Cys-tRNA(Cys) deacylase